MEIRAHNTYMVNEIFQSIEGEGKRAGSLVTFIRLAGCNLRCSYCDTDYALLSNQGTEMMIYEIIEEVQRISIGNLVTLTGGEPLMQEVGPLLYHLNQNGFKVNVETNGSYGLHGYDDRDPDSLFFTMDVKCPSSGMFGEMDMDNFSKLTEDDVVKFVVGSREDLDMTKDWIALMNEEGLYPQCYISPVFGQIEPHEIVEYMQDHKMFPTKIQLQMHKFIWDPNMRGV